MSSTGIINANFNDLETDNIDVNESLFINNINILELINTNFNDISGNIQDLSENIIIKINDLSGNTINEINDLSQNIIIKINDLSQNTINTINDLSQNLYDLSENVYDLSANVANIKTTTDSHGTTLLGHSLQIQGNSNALAATDTLLATTVATTGANSAALVTVIATIGIPSVAGITPSTGLYAGIDSKTSRSLFGSGNVAIYGLGPLEYINLVYNNDHFEDIKQISNYALNLKEPYKSLPTSLNNLSGVVDTKQKIFTCISPLIKNDISNNITIDLSAYPLKANVDSSLNNIISTK